MSEISNEGGSHGSYREILFGPSSDNAVDYLGLPASADDFWGSHTSGPESASSPLLNRMVNADVPAGDINTNTGDLDTFYLRTAANERQEDTRQQGEPQ
jgi:hypothetical protein